MAQVCPRCQHANPDAAVFCWFDGIVLRQGAAPPVVSLPHPFVFPSGRRCQTFDELVQGFRYEWEDARDMLRKGDVGEFLAHVGRHDLAQAAQESRAQPDADIALYNFIEGLPGAQAAGPRLDLHPRRLAIGPVRPAEQRQVYVTLTNEGKGLLQGKVAVTEGYPWLKIADGASETTFPLKTAKAQQVPLKIDARGLSGPRAYSGKLTVITNGGIAEVPIGLDVSALPFSLKGPFQGAANPRELAQRMRAHPKAAVPLLESGEVARWFLANGWAYPVIGAPARGVAGVQQFFEGMGLSKPPPLQLSESELRFVCAGHEPLRGAVTLRTTAKKWVYAQIDSDVPWLKTVSPAVSGPQHAQIAFEVDPAALDGGRVYTGTLQLVANAGQKLAVRVKVDVRRPQRPATSRALRPILVGAVVGLVLRLLMAVPADMIARSVAAPPEATLPIAEWFGPGEIEAQFLRPFVLATAWVGLVVGALLVVRRGGKQTDLFCGLVAGAFAGLLGSATLGCLLLVVDGLPRALLGAMTASHEPVLSPWRWLPAWIALTAITWSVAGGALGLVLSLLGRRGRQVMAALASPLEGLCRLCGLKRAAAFFLLQG